MRSKQLIRGKFPFIGGPLGGKLRHTSGIGKIEVRKYSNSTIKMSYKTVIYRLEFFQPRENVAPFAVYIIEYMSTEDAMRRLLKAYCINDVVDNS